MTPEQRVTWIQRIVLLLMFVGIPFAAFRYQSPVKKSPQKVTRKEEKSAVVQAEKKPVKEEAGNLVGTFHMTAPQDSTGEAFEKLVKNIKSPAQGVTVIHCHLLGDLASEELADTFNQIQKKYGKLVVVTRVGFQAQPKDWVEQKGIKLPYVMMIAGQENVFQFQGLWSYTKVDKKVAEIISGLRRVGKDWRPVVPGMSPKSH